MTIWPLYGDQIIVNMILKSTMTPMGPLGDKRSKIKIAAVLQSI